MSTTARGTGGKFAPKGKANEGKSRFEQRKDQGVEQIARAMGIEVNTDNAYVHLENTGSVTDLLRQQNLYWKEGYDKEGSDESGIIMSLPKDDVAANVKRYERISNERLKAAPPAGLAAEYNETGNKVEIGRRTTGQEFLEGDD